jgi:hypothetical protein
VGCGRIYIMGSVGIYYGRKTISFSGSETYLR